MPFTIVGKRFTPAEFENYVSGVTMGAWKPQFVTLHNTASPSLANRPNGFTAQHIENLRQYYSGMGWQGGPHLFIDDQGIWVFNPLNKRGTHSPCFNNIAWGVEMLGNYETESFTTGRGAKVRELTLSALATLHRKMGFDPGTLRLHKEDTCTDHACPGKKVDKATIISDLRAKTSLPIPPAAAELIIFRKGFINEPAAKVKLTVDKGKSFADARELAKGMGITTTATGLVGVVEFMKDYSLNWDKPANQLIAVEKYTLIIERADGVKTNIPLQIAADGLSWADIRKMSVAANIPTDKTGKAKITEFLTGYRFHWDLDARELHATPIA